MISSSAILHWIFQIALLDVFYASSIGLKHEQNIPYLDTSSLLLVLTPCSKLSLGLIGWCLPRSTALVGASGRSGRIRA